jgi:hypothetical protein
MTLDTLNLKPPCSQVAMTATLSVFFAILSATHLAPTHSFAPALGHRYATPQHQPTALHSTNTDRPESVESAAQQIEECKRQLIQMCDSHDLGSGFERNVETKIGELERLGREVCLLIISCALK